MSIEQILTLILVVLLVVLPSFYFILWRMFREITDLHRIALDAEQEMRRRP